MTRRVRLNSKLDLGSVSDVQVARSSAHRCFPFALDPLSRVWYAEQGRAAAVAHDARAAPVQPLDAPPDSHVHHPGERGAQQHGPDLVHVDELVVHGNFPKLNRGGPPRGLEHAVPAQVQLGPNLEGDEQAPRHELTQRVGVQEPERDDAADGEHEQAVEEPSVVVLEKRASFPIRAPFDPGPVRLPAGTHAACAPPVLARLGAGVELSKRRQPHGL
mmetsp:Transcript_5334/g.24021  ORF Transcript_5334/g.24021 Transcript_5334/m.24021 type:complete len:217 (-) Transcript_5334:1528-2178(-)